MDANAKMVDGYLVKGDAISLQGVWVNFPQAAEGGRLTFAAGLYEQMRRDEEAGLRSHPPGETPEQKRRRLIDEVEARIVRDREDDLFVLTNW